MKYRFLSLLLALAMLLSLVGCGSGSGDSSENAKNNAAMIMVGVALSGSQETNPYGAALESSLKQVGYTVEIAYAGSGDQISQISDLVTDGASILIVEPEDGDAVKSALESISVDVSDVPVIALDSSISSDTIRTHVGINYTELGKQQAQYIADTLNLEKMDEEDDPVTVEFLADESGCAEKALSGAMSVLKPYLDSGHLKVLSGNTTAASIETEDPSAWASKLFSTSYADTDLNAVLCFGEDQGTAVVDAVLAGYTGKVFPLIASCGHSEQSVQYLTQNFIGMLTLSDTDSIVTKAVDSVATIVNKSGTVNKEQLTEVTPVVLKDYKAQFIDSGLYTANDDGTFSRK